MRTWATSCTPAHSKPAARVCVLGFGFWLFAAFCHPRPAALKLIANSCRTPTPPNGTGEKAGKVRSGTGICQKNTGNIRSGTGIYKKNTGNLRSGTGICQKKYRYFTVRYRYLQKKYRHFTVRYRYLPKKYRYLTVRYRYLPKRIPELYGPVPVRTKRRPAFGS